MWLPWKGQPTILASRMIVSPDCQPILPMITPKYLTVEASPTEKHRRILPRPMVALFPWSHLRLALSQIWWHEDSNHMAASLPNWHNRRNIANGFTLASLYYSIVNPCHSKLAVCILFQSEAFVIYSELTKLQNRPHEHGVHRFGQAVGNHNGCRDPPACCMVTRLFLEKHNFYSGPPFLTIWHCISGD